MRHIIRIFSILLLTIIAFCAWSLFSHRMPWQHTEPMQHQLTIMTYNTQGMMIGESIHKKKAMLRYINQLDADIVCLQEVLVYKNEQRLTLPALRQAMSQYPYTYYDFKVYNSKRQFGNVVFSRYPLINKQTIRYESQSNISSQCDIVAHGDTLRLMVNHLESFKLNRDDISLDSLAIKDSKLNQKLSLSNHLRRQQALSVRKAAYHSPYPVIALGDFNAIPLSLVYWTMNCGLRDCFAESSFGQYGSTFQRQALAIRIDYIFCSRQLHPIDCHIGQANYSDHLPLIATIAW